MSYQMTALMQKKEGDNWVNVEILPRLVYRSQVMETRYVNNEIHNQRHWDWLGMDNVNSPIPHRIPKGIPIEEFEDHFHDLIDYYIVDKDGYQLYPYGQSWELIDDLLATNWEESFELFGEAVTLREYLGQPFIDWLQSLKDKGVERMIFSFSTANIN